MKIFKYLNFIPYLFKLIFRFVREAYFNYSIQSHLFKSTRFSIGKDVVINNFQGFTPPKGGKIGNYSRILLVGFLNDQKRNQSIYLGNQVIISQSVELTVWENNHLIIQDNTSVQDNCKLLGSVTIERNCLLAPNIFMSSGNHYYNHNPYDLIKNQDKEILSTQEGVQAHVKPIHIEEDCWLGLGTFVKRGVYIGKGAIIGAYTSVLKDVPPYTVQLGSPNQTVKKRLDFIPPSMINATNESHWPYFYRGFAQQASIRSKGLEQGGLFVHNKALITLEKKPFTTLKLTLFLNPGITSIEVTVSLNKVLISKLTLTPKQVQYNIDVTDEKYNQAINNLPLYPTILRSYHLFEFETSTDDAQDQLNYGVCCCEIV
ncbi:hypothetical protein BKI52_21025 [marine bacterium AO1-C]|nr:hypothetical protein BKI52_21025 [marine bacterium AO1-C]